MNILQSLFFNLFVNKDSSDLIWYKNELPKYVNEYIVFEDKSNNWTVIEESDGSYYSGEVYYPYDKNYCDIFSCIRITKYKIFKIFEGHHWTRQIDANYAYLLDPK